MASRYSPKIPTDGLVLAWDAANPKSYPRSGTAIYDLSGNGYHGTLYNGVSYDTESGGCLLFDGVNDYATSNSSVPNLSATNCTVIGASRYVSVNTGTSYGGGRIINGQSNNWVMGHWDRSAKKYYAEGWVTDSDGTESMPDTGWHLYATLNNYSSDQWTLYIDNAVDTGPNNGGSQGPYGFTLGRYGTVSSEYSNSKFSFLLAYNRILDATELTQVYTAFRIRFGL